MVGNPRTCPSNGATFCRYISWFGLSGNVACSKPAFHAHMKCAIEPHLHFNMMRFRLGCWYFSANDLKLKAPIFLEERGYVNCAFELDIRIWWRMKSMWCLSVLASNV